jgi:hypothetical protein
MRLVQDDPVRNAGLGAQLLERSQRLAKVGPSLLFPREREIDDHAAQPLLEDPRQMLCRRERLAASEHHHTVQATQGTVISFRVEDAHGVPKGDQPLGEEASRIGLAATASPGDQDVHARAGNRDGLARGAAPQVDLPASGLHTQLVAQNGPVQKTGDATTIGLAEHDVGQLLQGWHGVADGDADLAGFEKGLVVLGVADGHGAVARETELGQGLADSPSLGDARGQDHQLSAVARELAVESEAPQILDDGDVVFPIAGEQHLTPAKGDPALQQRLVQRHGHGRRQGTAHALAVQNRAVLCDQDVEVLGNVRKLLAQLCQDPPRDQHQLQASPPDAVHRLEHFS